MDPKIAKTLAEAKATLRAAPGGLFSVIYLGLIPLSLKWIYNISKHEERNLEKEERLKKFAFTDSPLYFLNKKETNEKRFQSLSDEEIIKEGEKRVKEAIILDAGEQE